MLLDVQVTPTAFYGNGKKKHEDRNKLLHQTGSQGMILDFCSFAEAVLSSHEYFPFLHAPGALGYGLQRWTNRGYKHTSRM